MPTRRSRCVSPSCAFAAATLGAVPARRLTVTLLAAAALLLSLPAVAGSSSVTTIGLTSHLTASQEIPPQTVKNLGASGTFTAQLRPVKNGYRLTWKLTYRGLTGRATTAYLHQGKPGAHGAALVHLCSLCTSGKTGSSYFSPPELKLVRAGKVYVNIRTAKNPSGEIRGQVRVR